MTAALCQGGSAGPSAKAFPFLPILHRVALALAFGWVLLHAGDARADAMYRCTGSSGEAVFTSKPAGYRHCHRMGSFRSARPHSRPAAAPHRTPPEIDFSTVKASVTTSAVALAEITPAEQMRRARESAFADVQASVVTTGQALAALPAPAVVGTPGQWSYREARADLTAAPVPSGEGDRVLRGAVYRVKRADGSVEYTNIKPASQRGHAVTMLFTYIATCMACDLHSPIHWNSVRLNLDAYASVIRRASSDFGVDEAFLRAIIHAESAFNPHAMSIKGAQGLMQLMPGTAGDMGVMDAFNAEQNIRGGARYLGQLLRTFNGNEKLAAAAYNAGPGAVQRYSGVPPYAETRVYVDRVATLRARYGRALHPVPLAAAAGASAIQ